MTMTMTRQPVKDDLGKGVWWLKLLYYIYIKTWLKSIYIYSVCFEQHYRNLN